MLTGLQYLKLDRHNNFQVFRVYKMKCVTILFICYLLFGFSQGYSQIPNYVPQNGLVGWWPFNGNANDESGNGNHGVMIDGASNVTDRFGTPNYALGLDGINDYVRLQYPFVDCVDFSISAWVLHTNKGNYSGILSDADMAPDNDLFFNINNSEIGITADKSGRNLKSCNLQPRQYNSSFYNKGSFDSVWVHIVVTTTQNQTKIYINGELKGESNVGGGNVGYHNPNPVFGKNTDQGWSIQYFRGKLDDIGIWDRVLDSNEIKRLFNNESSLCSYVIKESDTTICQGNTLELHTSNDFHLDSIPKEGLIGYWPFNGNANDESGNGNHGIVDKATLTSDKNNKPNSAYQFYKSGSKIAIPDAKILNNPFVSISFWLKTQDTLLQSYIYKSQEGTANHEEYGIVSNFTRENTLEFSIKNGSNCIPSSGWKRNIKDIVVFDGNWHHITATYDGIFSRMYVDTVLLSEIQDTFFPIDSCPGGDILFGKGWNNDANFDGVLDDIAIWNRAISPEEVKTMYKLNGPKKSLGLPTDGLIGFWPFNGNANDESGNGNHGKIIGELELTIDRFDKSSSSYNFTGNGHIQLPSINLPSFTLNAWVNRNTNTTDNGVVISKHYSSSRTNSSYLMYSAPEANNYCTPKLYFTNTSTNPSAVEAKNSSWCDSNWHMITGTLDTSWLKIYFDGVLVDSISGGVALSTDFPTLIGSSYSFQGDITNQNFGKIDDVAFYNRSLTGDEISRLFKTQSSNCRDTLSNDNFTWSTGEKGRNITVSPNTSTMYTLEVNRGQITDRDTIHVTVLESPKPDIFGHVKVYERQVNYSYYTQLNDSSTYEWKISGNGKLSSTNGGSSILVDFKEPGYAYLTVTETNKYGCKKDTTITIRIYGITDINESEKNSQMLTIYPNPINEFNSLTVQAFLPPSSRSYLTITNMLGKTLEAIELGNNDSYSEIKIPLSTEGLSNGVYMIQLHINGEYISRTLIINR
jgi:hypothetical protein